MPVGVCKIKDGWANQDSVIVKYDDGQTQEIPASQYISQGYQPDIERLPACPPKPEK